MHAETDILIKSTYDEPAYRAMAKATWKLFQKHRMEVMAYPALFSIAAVIVILLIFNWNTSPLPVRIGGIAFAILQFAVIPLGAMRAQRKTCRKAIRDAKRKGEYPAQVEFLFQGDRIRAKVAIPRPRPATKRLPIWPPCPSGGSSISPRAPISFRSPLFPARRNWTVLTASSPKNAARPLWFWRGTYPRADGTTTEG